MDKSNCIMVYYLFFLKTLYTLCTVHYKWLIIKKCWCLNCPRILKWITSEDYQICPAMGYSPRPFLPPCDYVVWHGTLSLVGQFLKNNFKPEKKWNFGVHNTRHVVKNKQRQSAYWALVAIIFPKVQLRSPLRLSALFSPIQWASSYIRHNVKSSHHVWRDSTTCAQKLLYHSSAARWWRQTYPQ